METQEQTQDKGLATIQVIESLEPIEKADKIETANLVGMSWAIVVKKGEFKPSDKVIYVGIDSILPEDKPWCDFMRERHFRVKTIKLRGQISQGIIFPCSILLDSGNEGSELSVGTDVTAALNVKKYSKDLPVSLRGDIAGCFPSFVPKTDEERIQNCSAILAELSDIPVYITVKCDGTSATFVHRSTKAWEPEFSVCSRNWSIKDAETSVYWNISRKYNIQQGLAALGRDLALQGEIVGDGIQDNPMGLSDHKYLVFSAYDIARGCYVDFEDLINICTALRLEMVPVLEPVTYITGKTVEDLLEMAKGNYDRTNTPREGIVIRPLKETYSHLLRGRLSFKVVNNDYLLKVEK